MLGQSRSSTVTWPDRRNWPRIGAFHLSPTPTDTETGLPSLPEPALFEFSLTILMLRNFSEFAWQSTLLYCTVLYISSDPIRFCV